MLIDVADCQAPSLLEPAHKKCIQEDDRGNETATTDVGSAHSSDAESATSTSSAATRSRCRSGYPARVRFGSTLETIPGTPIAESHQEQGTGMSFLPLTPKKKVSLKEEVSDYHEYSADESDLERVRPLTELLDQSYGDQSLPLPPPRSPKRRSKSASSVKPAVNAASMNSFCTVPVMCSEKKRPRQTSVPVQGDCPTITSAMHGKLGTTPVKPRRSRKSRAPQPNAMPITSDGELSTTGMATGIYGTIPAPPPQSPKKRAHDALPSDARPEHIPLKVDLAWSPEAGLRKTLNFALPAKKKPIFHDLVGREACAALHRLETGLPVKKRVTAFLLEEPPRAMQPPPGLSMAR